MASSALSSGAAGDARLSLMETKTRTDVVISEKLCQASARIAKLPVKEKAINFRPVNSVFNMMDIKAALSLVVILSFSVLDFAKSTVLPNFNYNILL